MDDPDGAVNDADQLVGRVMVARGYPTEDFDRLADDVSVDHPHVVENYRTARALMTRRASGSVQTEELRQAVVNYRALFTNLLEVEHHHHAQPTSVRDHPLIARAVQPRRDASPDAAICHRAGRTSR